MELTKERIKKIIADYDKLYDEVEKGMHRSNDPKDWDWYNDGRPSDPFIDRYKQIGDAEFCITTSYCEDVNESASKFDADGGVTYLSEYVKVDVDGDVEEYSYGQLKEMVG